MGIHSMLLNAARTMTGLSGYHRSDLSAKHNHYKDFGWPDDPQFEDFYRMYQRNSLATAAVNTTISKSWETYPELWESEKPTESQTEKDVRLHFRKIRFWWKLREVDLRSMVGRYSAAVLLLADGQTLDKPVGRLSRIEDLVGVIPAWENQLRAGDLETNDTSPDYGKPRFYYFSERVGKAGARDVKIHPDRVVIWSEDGTMDGESALKPGFNDLIDAEKIKGAGGEGFWKTSRGAPIIQAPDGVKPSDVARAMGVETKDVLDKINEQLESFQQGFDKGLMLGGMTATPLSISLPSPEPFFNISVQSFSASVTIPYRILLGNQTGERASSEDSREWSKTNMSRRINLCMPGIQEVIDRLVEWGAIPNADWTIGWQDLTEATAEERMDRAAKLAEINSKTIPGDEPAFYPNEIREAAGYDPLDEIDKVRGEDDGEDDPLADPPKPEDDEIDPPDKKEPEDEQ